MRKIVAILFIISYLVIKCTSDKTSSMENYPPHFVKQVADPVADTFDIMSEEIKIPTEDAGYTLICPKENIQGLIVVFHAGRDTSHAGFEQRLAFSALRKNVATMYVTTGHRFDFLFDTSRMVTLDNYIDEVITENHIPKRHVMYTGMSLAGTRALKLALWNYQGHGINRPTAIAICDAPLDFIRFWTAHRHTITNQTHPTSVGEAEWTSYLLETNLGGTPFEARENFIAYSPYVKLNEIDPKLKAIVDLPIRFYSEPDLDWWLENRNRDAYGINSMDASALVNDLRLLGNESAFHITTSNKGYRPDGTRHPHSWSIVDNDELVKWFLGL